MLFGPRPITFAWFRDEPLLIHDDRRLPGGERSAIPSANSASFGAMDHPAAPRAPLGLLDQPAWVRWGAHLAFWLVYLAVRTAAAGAEPPEEMREFPYLANRLLVVASYCVLTGVLMAALAGPLARRSDWARNLALVIGAVALAPVMQWIEEFWPRTLANVPPQSNAVIT